MKLVGRLKRRNSFVDLWHVKADFNISDCVLQEEEVDDVKMVSPKDLVKIIFEAEYRDEDYKAIVQKFMVIN